VLRRRDTRGHVITSVRDREARRRTPEERRRTPRSWVSATSDSGTAAPSNTPGGFVLWELRSTFRPSGPPSLTPRPPYLG
jgi:hypothetical protein